MTPVPALGLSFPSCTVRFLEYPMPWRFEVAMLPGSAVGARGGLSSCSLARSSPQGSRPPLISGNCFTGPPLLSHMGSLLIPQIHMGYPIFQKLDMEVLRRREARPGSPGTVPPLLSPSQPGELTPGYLCSLPGRTPGGVTGAGPNPHIPPNLTDCRPGAVGQPGHHTESGGQEAGQEGEAGEKGGSPSGSGIPPPAQGCGA